MDNNNSVDETVRISSPVPLLPRSAWTSQLTKLRLTLTVKQLLDQQERTLKNN
ncbi:MAG: hypothetical protein ACFB14_08645 [Leptolyngbyaceae cyanobacterium]